MPLFVDFEELIAIYDLLDLEDYIACKCIRKALDVLTGSCIGFRVRRKNWWQLPQWIGRRECVLDVRRPFDAILSERGLPC